jgi:hypothetical protein
MYPSSFGWLDQAFHIGSCVEAAPADAIVSCRCLVGKPFDVGFTQQKKNIPPSRNRFPNRFISACPESVAEAAIQPGLSASIYIIFDTDDDWKRA